MFFCPFSSILLPINCQQSNKTQHFPGLGGHMLKAREHSSHSVFTDTHSALTAAYIPQGNFYSSDRLKKSQSHRLSRCFHFFVDDLISAAFPLSLLLCGRLDRAWERSERLKNLYIRTICLPSPYILFCFTIHDMTA